MLLLAASLNLTASVPSPPPNSLRPDIILVTGTVTPPAPDASLTPEQKMQKRYPQPVKVGDLIGLRMLDDEDRTLGRIRTVVRTTEGKIQLIVPYGGFLGVGKRLVAVPIEVVAIAGRQVAALDMDRAAFDAAPTWKEGASSALPATEMIRIALYKR